MKFLHRFKLHYFKDEKNKIAKNSSNQTQILANSKSPDDEVLCFILWTNKTTGKNQAQWVRNSLSAVPPWDLHSIKTSLFLHYSPLFYDPFRHRAISNINPSHIFHFHHMNHFMLHNPPFKVVQLINIGVFLPPKRGLEWISVNVLVQLTFTSLPLTFPFKALMHPQHLRSRIPINESAVSFMGGGCAHPV